MQTFLVRRRGIGASANDLDAALTRLRAFEESASLASSASWLHSYALREAQGGFGLACVFQAEDADALRWHAQATRLPADEILRVAATLIVRPFAAALVHLVRRRSGWRTAADFEDSAALARRIADEQMARRVSWLRSYAVEEEDGRAGSCCLYQSIDAAALAGHGERAGMPVDEITQVLGRIVFRDDARDPSRPLGAPGPESTFSPA